MVVKLLDLIFMVLDVCKLEAANSRYAYKDIFTREFEVVGLRLNKKLLGIYWKKKKVGGV